MPAQKTKSNAITFVLIIYALFCLSYSVLVHDGTYSLQLSGSDASVEKLLREGFRLPVCDDAAGVAVGRVGLRTPRVVRADLPGIRVGGPHLLRDVLGSLSCACAECP